MNEKLIVKNFGPIRDAELELKKTTVFIGPQGSGKSTLAKLVAIFNDYNLLISEMLWTDVKSGLFKNYSLNNFFKIDSQLEWVSDRNKSIFTEGQINSVLNHSINEGLNKFISENYMVDTFESFKQYVYKRNIERHFIGNRYSLSSRFFSTFLPMFFPTPKYMPTERQFISSIAESALGLINNEIALNKTITSFGNDFERARRFFSENHSLFIDYLKINYQYTNGIDTVTHQDTYNQDEKVVSVRLSESASGYQSVIPIHIVTDFFTFQENVVSNPLVEQEYIFTPGPYTILIIEEPELNLYPFAQKGLIKYLSARCSSSEHELVITTHSPYVLTSFNLMMLAYRVWEKHPSRESDISAIVPKESWLNPDEFAAYYVADGTVRSIIDPALGLIDDNELDDVSEDNAGDLDLLMKIYRSKSEINEAVS